MAADAQPQVTAADVRLPATVAATPRLAVMVADRRTAVAHRTVVAHHTVADRRTAAVVADMGGNT